jgi:multiple sugar transport system permease protein
MRNDNGLGHPILLSGGRIASYTVLVFLSILCIFPFVILIINSTRMHAEIIKGFSIIPGSYFLVNLTDLLKDTNIPMLRGLANSVFVSSTSAILAIYFSTMTAYGIYMYRFKGRNFAYNFIILVMMVPTQVAAMGFIKMIIDIDLMDSFIPLIVPAIAAPIIVFFMLQYMQSVLPFEIVESARMDGANEFLTFNRIVVPILSPALAVQAIFSFVSSWNNYFLPALLLNSKENRTIPIIIAQLRSADYMKFNYGKVYMMICIAIVPLIIVYLFLSRFIIKGVTMGSVKG